MFKLLRLCHVVFANDVQDYTNPEHAICKYMYFISGDRMTVQVWYHANDKTSKIDTTAGVMIGCV